MDELKALIERAVERAAFYRIWHNLPVARDGTFMSHPVRVTPAASALAFSNGFWEQAWYQDRSGECGATQPVDSYGDWECDVCGAEYEYDEGHRLIYPERYFDAKLIESIKAKTTFGPKGSCDAS